MFDFLLGVGVELRSELVQVYWVLLAPYVAFLLLLEVISNESPNVKEILKRVLISVLLLYSFDWAIDSLAVIGEAVTERIDGLTKLQEVLSHLGPNMKSPESMFSLRDNAIYIFSLAAYVIAYVGFFAATALTHFVWTILYITSPLMILMFVSPKTSYVTSSLYKGLVQVVVWKVLYAILGVLLLKLAMQTKINAGETGLEDYLLSMIVNLCIGVSMLFIPIATKSLIGDGLSSLASTLALAPAFVAAGTVKMATAKIAGRLSGGIKGAAGFVAKPLTNQVTARYENLKDRFGPRFSKIKRRYESIGLGHQGGEGRQAARKPFNNQRRKL